MPNTQGQRGIVNGHWERSEPRSAWLLLLARLSVAELRTLGEHVLEITRGQEAAQPSQDTRIFDSSRRGHSNSLPKIVKPIGITTSAGPGNTSIAMPTASTSPPLTATTSRLTVLRPEPASGPVGDPPAFARRISEATNGPPSSRAMTTMLTQVGIQIRAPGGPTA